MWLASRSLLYIISYTKTTQPVFYLKKSSFNDIMIILRNTSSQFTLVVNTCGYSRYGGNAPDGTWTYDIMLLIRATWLVLYQSIVLLQFFPV